MGLTQRSVVKLLWIGLMVMILGGLSSGCSSPEVRTQSEQQSATIKALNDEIQRLNNELDSLLSSREELARAKAELESQLGDQMAAGNLSLAMEARGLVVTVLDRILFDSGRADLKDTAIETLDTVAGVLRDQVGNNMIYVEGHTDNVPIRYSGWRSNWELASARALEVLHYFTQDRGLKAGHFAAVSYGEFHPLTLNHTVDDRQKNRRVEIVISPRKL